MADRLGVDVGVGGFEAFERNMRRVDELMALFAERVNPLKQAAGTFEEAIEKLKAAGKDADGGGLQNFLNAARDFSKSGRTMTSVTRHINNIADAFQKLRQASTGAGNILQGLQSVASTQAPAARRAPGARTATAQPDISRQTQAQINLMIQLRKEAEKADQAVVAQQERQAEALQRIRQRQQDRRLQDEKRFAAQAIRVREQAEDSAFRESKRLGRRATDEVRSTAATEASFSRISRQVEDRARELEERLRGKLADALLNKGEEAEIKRRIDTVVGDIQNKLAGIRESRVGRVVDRNDIESLRDLQRELRNVAAATDQQIQRQQKIRQTPSVARLARQRALDETGRLSAGQFATGQIAKAAQSANPVIRTFARTIFAVEDAAAAARLSTEAFGIVLRRILGTLEAISLPIRLLAGLFRFLGVNVGAALGPIQFFLRLVGFKGAGEIANFNRETDALVSKFKNFKPQAFTDSIDASTKAAKKAQVQFRELGLELPGLQVSKRQQPATTVRPQRIQRGEETDVAAAAERSRQAVAAVFRKAEEDRSRSAQRQASIASQAQAKIEAIEQTATARVSALEQQREQVRSAIQQQSTQAQTRASQQRLQQLVEIEQRIGQAISNTQASAAQSIEKQNQALAKASPAAARALQQARDESGRFANEIKRAGDESAQAAGKISRLGQIAITAIGTAIGNLAVRAVQNLSFALQGLGGQILTSVGDYQNLQRVFASQVRVELLDSGQVTDFSEATQIATDRAAELLSWTEQLAIASPFGANDVAQVFSLARSYSFSTEEAQKLTNVLVDFAAGSGRTISEAEGIGRALGQIRTNGRLLKEELNQLAERGVPAMSILAKATGKTTEEFNEFLRKGGSLDAESAITAIVKALGENFTGAAKESQATVRGLINSLQDLRDISLRNLFQPLVEQIAIPLGGSIVDAINTQEFQGRLKEIGQTIADAFNNVVGAIGQSIGAVQGLIGLIPEPLIEIAKASAIAAAGLFLIPPALSAIGLAASAIASLGGLLLSLINPVTLLATAIGTLFVAWQRDWFGIQQIVQTAKDNVLAVIDQLRTNLTTGNIFSGLVDVPQFVADIATSVVKVATDLVKSMAEFGANIVEQLASGIISAVGAVLDALAVLGQAITSLLAPGSPPKLLPELTEWGKGAADAYLEGWNLADFDLLDKLTSQISQALTTIGDEVQGEQFTAITHAISEAIRSVNEFGFVSQEAFDQIVHVSEDFGEELGRLTTAYFDAAIAAKELDRLQKELNQTTKRYDDLLKPIDARLKAISGAQSAQDEASEQKNLQNVINNRFATEGQKRKAQLKLEELSLTQQKRALEEQRDAAVSSLETRISTAEEEKRVAEETASVLEKRFGIELNAIKLFQGELEKAGDGADSLGERLKKAKKEKEKLGEIDLGLGSLADLEFDVPDVSGKLAPVIEGFQQKLAEGQKSITDTFTSLQEKVQTTIDGIVTAFNDGLAGITDPEATSLGRAANSIGLIVGQIGEFVDTIKSRMEELRLAFSAGFSGLSPIEVGGKGQERVLADPISDLARRAGVAALSLNTAFTNAVTAAQGFATDFAAAFNAEEGGSVIDKVLAALDSEPIQGRLETLKGNLIAEINNIFGGEGETVDVSAIQTKITEAVNGLFESGKAAGQAGVSGFSTLAANVYAAISSALGSDETIDTAVLKTNIENAINGLFAAGAEAGSGLVTTVTTQLDLLFGDVTFSDLTTSFGNLASQVGTAISEVKWSDVITSNLFTSLQDAVKQAISGIFGGLQSLLSGDLGGAASKVQSGFEGAGKAIGAVTGNLGGLAGNLLKDVNFGQIAGAISASITTFVSGAIRAVPDLLKTALDALSAGEESLLKTTGKLIGGTVAGVIGGIVVAVVAQLKTLLTPEGIRGLVTGISDLVESAGKAASDVIVGIVQGIIDTLDPGGSADVQAAMQKLDELFNPQNFGFEGGKKFRENLKEGTGFDLGIVGEQVNKFVDLVIDNFTKTKDAIGRFGAFVSGAISALPENFGKLVTDLDIVGLRFAKVNADVSLRIAKSQDAAAKAMDFVINGILGIVSSVIESINSLVRRVNEFSTSLPFIGESAELPEVPQIKPSQISLNTEANVANLEAAAQKAADDLSAALEKKKLAAPPIETDAVQAETAGQDWSLAYLGGAEAGVSANIDKAKTLGVDIATGVTEGAQTQLDNTDLFFQYIEAQAQSIEAQSPSQVAFRLLGVPIAQGVIDGANSILQTDTSIADSINNLFGTAGVQQTASAGAQAIATRFQTMAAGVKATFQDMARSVRESFSNIRVGSISETSAMIKALEKAYKKFIKDNTSRFEKYAKDVVKIFDNLSKDLIKITDSMIRTLNQLLSGFVERVLSEFRRMRDGVTSAVKAMADSVVSEFARMRDRMIELARAGADGAISQFQRLGPALTAEIANLIAILTSAQTLAAIRKGGEDIGHAIIEGIADGIRRRSGEHAIAIADAILSLIPRVVRLIESELASGGAPPPIGPGPSSPGSEFDQPASHFLSSIRSLSENSLDQLVAINQYLLEIRDAVIGGGLVSAGMVTGQSIAGSVINNGGTVNNVYELTIQGVSERVAIRAASSFEMFERLNGR